MRQAASSVALNLSSLLSDDPGESLYASVAALRVGAYTQ